MLNHLAIIPDGNRRYARKLGKPPWYGHEIGIKSFRNVINWCLELGIKELTFYTLSVKNFKRDKTELHFLFQYIRKEIDHWLNSKDAKKNGVCIRALGRTYLLPKDIQQKVKKVTQKTKNNKKLKVNLMIGYGGREEIIEAVKKLIKNKQKVTEKNFSANLWLNSNPDLVIRTSGEYRTSDFLPWQAAYSEWYFTKKYWPEFSKKELLKAIKDFNSRERRYGK